MQDGFKLRLGISKADSLQKERIELLSKLDLPSVGEFLLKPGMEPISDTLLAFLRVFSMRKAELTHWLRSDKVFDLKHVDCALETVVEENVRKFLLTRLQLLIANYPTTLKVKVKPDVAPLLRPSLSTARSSMLIQHEYFRFFFCRRIWTYWRPRYHRWKKWRFNWELRKREFFRAHSNTWSNG